MARASGALYSKPAPGQQDIVLYLVNRSAEPDGQGGPVVWHRPRLEVPGKAPLLLRDYANMGAPMRSIMP